MIRVVIADDHAVVRSGLHLLLDMEENTRITAQALAQIARRMGQ